MILEDCKLSPSTLREVTDVGLTREANTLPSNTLLIRTLLLLLHLLQSQTQTIDDMSVSKQRNVSLLFVGIHGLL